MPLASSRASKKGIHRLAAVITLVTSAITAAATTAPQALQALKGLRSVVNLGVNQHDYQQRLIDAKIVVDQYLEEKPSPPQLRGAIAKALGYYESALTIWQSQTGYGVPLVMFAVVRRDSCAKLRDLGAEVVGNREHLVADPNTHASEGEAQQLIRTLWRCASDQIAEADKWLAGRKK